jgi:hypothetical protein
MSRRMQLAGNVARGERRNMLRILVGKPEEKIPLGRPRLRWADIREIGLLVMDWIEQNSDRWRALVNTALNLRVPQNRGKFLSRSLVNN